MQGTICARSSEDGKTVFPIASRGCQREKKKRLVKSVETLDQKVGCVNGSAAGRYGATSQARESPCLSMPLQIIDLELVIRNPCILFFRYRSVIVYSERIHRQVFRQEERKELPSPRIEHRSGGSFGTIESSARMSQS